MRIGRLQSSTLNNILRSLEKGSNIEDSMPLQKQYIPTSFDSPLYRLVTVIHSDDDNRPINVPQTIRDSTLRSNSLPFLFASDRIPDSRTTQSSICLLQEINNQSQEEKKSNLLPDTENANPKVPWTKEYEHIDVDWSMQAMDVLYNASFYDYVRDEKNLELSSIRLARIIKDYKPKQVAAALVWMIQGWTVENTAKLLRSVFSDWLPDLAGCVFSLISKRWPKKPQLSLCTAYLLLSEPATSSALFIRTLTSAWSKQDTIELISYLDNLLEWDSEYLKEFMSVYASVSSKSSQERIFFNKLPTETLNDKKLNLASCKLALADTKLHIAEYRLNILKHFTSCQACQEGTECEEMKKLENPSEILGHAKELENQLQKLYIEEENQTCISSNSSEYGPVSKNTKKEEEGHGIQ